jgi:hypothetical protein
VTVHGTLGQRPLPQTPVIGNNSRNFRHWSKNEIPRNPRLQHEKKNEIIHLEGESARAGKDSRNFPLAGVRPLGRW